MSRINRAQIIESVRRQFPAIAHHEAGHAVFSWATQRELGHDYPPFHRVFLRRPEQVFRPHVDRSGTKRHMLNGMVEYIIQRYDPSKPLMKHLRAEVITSLGGPLAEQRFLEWPPPFGWWSPMDAIDDFEHAEYLVEDFTKSDRRKAGKILALCWQTAQELILRDDFWKAIQALAGELLVKYRINGKRAVQIIDNAAGWQPMH
jgi:hypothetical protein